MVIKAPGVVVDKTSDVNDTLVPSIVVVHHGVVIFPGNVLDAPPVIVCVS